MVWFRSGRFGDTFRLGWMSNLGRTGDTMVRVTGRHRHRAGRLRSGRFCDTMRQLLHIEVWFSALATLRCAVQGVVQRYQWGVQATCACVSVSPLLRTSSSGIATSAYDRSVQMLDTGIGFVRPSQQAGLPTVGTLHTIRLGRCAWWPVGHNTLEGLMYC